MVSGGVAFSGSRSVFASEGSTGRVSLIDLDSGERRHAIDLEEGSTSGDIVLDTSRNILYVADAAHSRVVIVDTKSRRSVAAIALKGVPGLLRLAPDRQKLYVTLGHNLLETNGVAGPQVAAVDVVKPQVAHVSAVISVGSALTGMVATNDRVFVSDAGDDSIMSIDASTYQIERRIPIRIPGLEPLRGVSPMGLAYELRSGWLLAAEAGINAVAVIEARTGEILGHIPAGRFPTQVAIDRGTVYIANAKGSGAVTDFRGNRGLQGSVSMFPVPAADTLAGATNFVMQAAGLTPRPSSPPPLPSGIRYVLLIVKDGRSFDEVLGDVTRTSNGTVMSAPPLARFGRDGYVDGQGKRLSLHHLDVTPNHHAIAERWTFSDNFYSDAETSLEGMHWLSMWKHLARHGVSYSRFEEPFEAELPDTERARRLIAEIQEKYGRRGAELPQFLMIHLPNDRMAPPRPEAGYPYAESYLADNDLALGRILEYFSTTEWWKQMAVFVTEASAEDGVDHIDAHRTLLLCAGPWARKNSVSHLNTSFPGLVKTIFRLLRVPPLNLSDATAADLSDCFTSRPDLGPYRAIAVDSRLYSR
jgi:DNA-binding beta-propeller fold protein YncE